MFVTSFAVAVVVDGAVVYVVVGFGVVVVPAEDDGQVPLAAAPSSARNSMKTMNPKAVSVASSAMLCLDQYRVKHLLTIAQAD
jgi:hypothetical protein